MDFWMESIWVNVLIFVFAIVGITVAYFKYSYTYWSRRNVISVPPVAPFGNFARSTLQKTSFGEQAISLYNLLKDSGKPCAGIYVFAKPVLLLLDPELCKNIMAKDFQNFHARSTYSDEKNEPLIGHLLNLNGSKWKFMRSKLTPTFSSGKMKMMFQTLVACSDGLGVILDEHVQMNDPLEIKDLMGRFTTDIIGSCAFGIDCNSLKDPDNIFRKRGKRIFEPTAIDAFKFLFSGQFPKLFAFFGFKRFPAECREFFPSIVQETVNYREKNNITRKDFMQLLIQLKSQGYVDGEDKQDGTHKKLTMDQVAAQSFVFFLAGFETSSTTMSAILHELCLHQDVQDNVRNEVNEVLKKYDGKITYEAIMEMSYMDKVIDESMRLHSVVFILERQCTADYKIPNSDLEVKKGTTIYIPVRGFHMDPRFYPNPEVFDPERFTPEEKAKRHPYAFLPFGAGPRNCIGLRFGMMQMKVGLVTLLRNHRFTLNAKTQTPLRQNPKMRLYNILGGIWVNVETVQ